MRQLVTLLLVVIAGTGCVDAAANLDPATDALREVVVVARGPQDRLAQASNITGGVGAQTAGVFEGRAAIGTSTGVLASNTNAFDALAQVQTVAVDGGSRDVGAVLYIGRRGSSGALVISEQGLFHSRSGVLLESPFSASLENRQVLTVDSYGEGAAEELWLLTPEGVLHAGGGVLKSVNLTGVGAKPEAVVAFGADAALLFADGSLYEISLNENSATRLAKGLGYVASAERGEAGTVYFATDDGLLEVTRDRALTLHTFAAEGQPGKQVLSVAAASGFVVASTDTELFSVESAGTFRIATQPGVLLRGLAIDAAGDTFAASSSLLRRYKTGKPVSFDADVKPFFSAHCMSCHRGGTSGARAINFEDYETAKQNAGNALNRMNAVGVAPMPPSNVETLSAADYAVVTRWVGGGMAP